MIFLNVFRHHYSQMQAYMVIRPLKNGCLKNGGLKLDLGPGIVGYQKMDFKMVIYST